MRPSYKIPMLWRHLGTIQVGEDLGGLYSKPPQEEQGQQ